jgi:hypothetical protein
MSNHFSGVMAGLVAAIHIFPHPTLPRERGRVGWGKKDVDARDKRGHDGGEVIRSHRNTF